MLLHDELERAAALAGPQSSGRLRRDAEVALAIVFGEPAVLTEIRQIRLGFLRSSTPRHRDSSEGRADVPVQHAQRVDHRVDAAGARLERGGGGKRGPMKTHSTTH